ncbi:hypothetical protein [Paenibacillus sp. J2TS4]|uniref:hypothetical protein n=1 Tax=Paenibacillus sp. J2TS4 TaxID=2807194 RepID=UPI001B2CAE90|nr:hypothetical protein [Paenibacillus sp. J2TS4]GIP35989.1 hypothetical protein J2TS4_51990 [Paenibacillus sp. J2TS4]
MNLHFSEVDLIGKLADLKEEHYRQTLVLSSIIELLIDKGVITREEIEAMARKLDPVIPNPDYPIPWDDQNKYPLK